MQRVRAILLLPLRVVVFVVGFTAAWMEVAADWLVGARGRTEYVRQGACKRCGRCCQCLALIMPEGMVRRSWLVRLASAWHGWAMNFHFIGEEQGWLVYSCRYYREPGERGPARHASLAWFLGKGSRGEAGGCTIYPFRHRLCRFFPRQKLYGHPPVHPDCGFSFVRRDVLERRSAAKQVGRPDFAALLAQRRRAPAADLPLSSAAQGDRGAPSGEEARR